MDNSENSGTLKLPESLFGGIIAKADEIAIDDVVNDEILPLDELYFRNTRPECGNKTKAEDGIYILKPYAIGNFLADPSDLDDSCPILDDNGDYYGFKDYWEHCGLWCSIGISGSVAASSTLERQGNIIYDAINVAEFNNFDRNFVWSEGVQGYGVGENITIKQTLLSSDIIPFTYNKMCIVNGYAKNEKLWAGNSRVKAMKLYVDDELYAYIQLEDTIKPQYFALYDISTFSTVEMSFRFEIDDVYPRGEYDDTCVTGIMFGFDGIGRH